MLSSSWAGFEFCNWRAPKCSKWNDKVLSQSPRCLVSFATCIVCCELLWTYVNNSPEHPRIVFLRLVCNLRILEAQLSMSHPDSDIFLRPPLSRSICTGKHMIAVATLSARPMEKCCDSRTMHTIHGKCLNTLQALVFLMPATLAQVTNKIGCNKQDKTTALKKHRFRLLKSKSTCIMLTILTDVVMKHCIAWHASIWRFNMRASSCMSNAASGPRAKTWTHQEIASKLAGLNRGCMCSSTQWVDSISWRSDMRRWWGTFTSCLFSLSLVPCATRSFFHFSTVGFWWFVNIEAIYWEVQLSPRQARTRPGKRR